MKSKDLFSMKPYLVALTLLALSCPAAAAGESPTAREQYDKAMVLYEHKQFDEAKKLLLELWGKNRTHDVATTLGQVENKQGHFAEAAKYFAFAVAKFPPTEELKRLDVIKGRLLEVQKRVLTYNLKVNVEGATVSVDGAVVDQSPLATAVFLDPGTHIVVVRKEGYKSADRKMTAVAGGTDSWDVTLQAVEQEPKVVAPVAPTGPAAATVHPFVEPPRDSAPKPNPWILVGGGAVTVGALVTGLVLNSKANSALDDARSKQGEHATNYCSLPASSNSTYCTSLHSDFERGDRLANYSTAAFVVAGAAATGTAVYWLWPRKNAQAATGQVLVRPAFSPAAAGVSVLGDF